MKIKSFYQITFIIKTLICFIILSSFYSRNIFADGNNILLAPGSFTNVSQNRDHNALLETVSSYDSFIKISTPKESIDPDLLGREPISFSIKGGNILSRKPLIHSSNIAGNIIFVGEGELVISQLAGDFHNLDSMLMTQHIATCSVTMGTVTLKNGERLLLMAHMLKHAHGQAANILETLMVKKLIISANLNFFASPSDKNLERIKKRFNKLNKKHTDFKLELNVKNVESFERAATISTQAGENSINAKGILWEKSKKTLDNIYKNAAKNPDINDSTEIIINYAENPKDVYFDNLSFNPISKPVNNTLLPISS